MVIPVFQVPGFEHVTDKPEEPLVVDFLRQYPEKDLMVERPVAVGDITLDKPHGARPGLADLPQCGVTSASFPESVRPAREPRLVDRLQQEADHFADQLVGP